MAPGILLRSPSPYPQVLTASPSHPAPADLHPASRQLLLSTLSESPHTFLQPPSSLHTAALVLAKRYLDPLAASVSETQEERLQTLRKKRKRGEEDVGSGEITLRLKQVYLEGLGIDQIWEQVRRVLDATRHEIQRYIPDILRESKDDLPHKIGNGKITNAKVSGTKSVRFEESNLEVGSSEEEARQDHDADLDKMEVDYEEGGLDDDDDDGDGDGDGDAEGGIEEEDIMEDDEKDYQDLGSDAEEEQEEVFVPDKYGLNDGFFSIDEFNRTSEFLEQQDARAGANDPDSDDEEIDWDADPLAITGSISNPNGQINGDNAEDYNDSEDDGPTFGNADLNAPDTSDEDDNSLDEFGTIRDMDTTANTNDIRYADFFAPPALPNKRKRRRLNPKTQPPPRTQAQQAEHEDDIQRTISAVRRDLFEDDNDLTDPDADEEQDRDPSTSNRNSNLSTHEKRQLALQKQIRDLEAANVAKRQWTLQGEARAAERPLNSLLEEDLDFERTGKPVPVITNEVSEDIEALIKRRILARDFDEVIKRQPGTLRGSGLPSARRGLVDLPQTKDPLSLSEVYEKAHLEATSTSDSKPVDPKLAAQHAEIARLWASVSSKLDALSNFHFKPKPPDLQITVVSDVPAVQMEDARPSGVGGVGDIGGAEGRLAPQEVYNPKEGREKGEVVLTSGLPVQKEEMTREEKLRRRRREKERLRKSEDKGRGKGKTAATGVVAKAKDEKTKKKKDNEILGALKKGGVKVIGKKGDIRDLTGKKADMRGSTGIGKTGGVFKL